MEVNAEAAYETHITGLWFDKIYKSKRNNESFSLCLQLHKEKEFQNLLTISLTKYN